MNHITSLQLINGTFSPEEAKDILVSLFVDKIRFHQIKSFSSLERTGKADLLAEERIVELKKSIQQLKKIIEEAHKKNKQLVVSSHIDLFEKDIQQTDSAILE